MQIDRDAIMQAKEKLGDDNARIIIEELGIVDYDERDMKCCCPFHQEDHASFIYNKKAFNFRCFGACSRSYDILDVLMYKGMTYAQACRKLFDLAGMPYSFGELGVKTRRQYQYPKEVICDDKSRVYEYFQKRKISPQTIDYADVRQDSEGNTVFNYYDTNDVLTMVKYRPSRKVKKGENKCWCQKGADTTPLLFNMNRINTTVPLLICEGEPDCLSAIESGFTNAVSVPLGSTNFHWIEENWDFLEQFDSILIAKNYAGLQEMNELISRSTRDDHFYYKPRISFDEFLGLSDNVIKISACLASPLNKMSIRHPMYERILKHYDYLEIQPHDHPEQIAYNRHLVDMSQRYRIPLIAGTDTHSLNKYKAECRSIMQLSKHIEFADEDSFDLTYKSYEELVRVKQTRKFGGMLFRPDLLAAERLPD